MLACAPMAKCHMYEWLCSIDDNYRCALMHMPSVLDEQMEAVSDEVALESSASDSLMEWMLAEYTHHLNAAPILTKSVTAAIVGWVGDLLAQWFERSSATKVQHFVSSLGTDVYCFYFLGSKIGREHV